jgi:hypothetical protein
LILFPRNPKKARAGDATPEEQAKAVQQTGTLLPDIRPAHVKLETIKTRYLKYYLLMILTW